MNKTIKIILITCIAVFGLGFFAVPPAKATAVGQLIVEWSTNGTNWQLLSGPIFNETNFLPADGVSRLIRATNNTAGTLKIGTKATNFSTCFGICFADKLKLKITDQSSNTLYEKSLTDFFKEEEVALSDVASGGVAIYNFSITFLPDSDNDYQNTNVSFNLIVGALGTESIGGETTSSEGGGGSGSGGGYFVPGLEISNENASAIGGGQATITWDTNKGATSRVIYSAAGENHTLLLDSPPEYGYAHSTGEISTSVVGHSMIITGLAPGTTYYFRCVSRGSFAVSMEHSFTTPGIKITGEESSEENNTIPPTTAGGENIVSLGNGSAPAAGGEAFPEELATRQIQGTTTEGGVGNQEPAGVGLGSLLAAIGAMPFNLKLILIVVGLVILFLIILWLFGRRKKEEE